MTAARRDSVRPVFSIQQNLHPSQMSFISSLPNKGTKTTRLQVEHMDDWGPGAGALGGGVPGQYVVVWQNSYEMNRELKRIHKFRDSVMVHKPEGWADDAFWNLVANVHLENQGFADKKRPTPVRIPLEVGNLLLFDFMVIHSGMPHVNGVKSLRWHMYWAQIHGRKGDFAHQATVWPWLTSHLFYPGWKLIEGNRRPFHD